MPDIISLTKATFPPLALLLQVPNWLNPSTQGVSIFSRLLCMSESFFACLGTTPPETDQSLTGLESGPAGSTTLGLSWQGMPGERSQSLDLLQAPQSVTDAPTQLSQNPPAPPPSSQQPTTPPTAVLPVPTPLAPTISPPPRSHYRPRLQHSLEIFRSMLNLSLL